VNPLLNFKTRLTTISALGAALFSHSAWAHPGTHNHDAMAQFMHLISEPDHVAWLVLGLSAAWIGSRIVRRRRAASMSAKKQHEPL
jgi:hydrogenase/urease accessory protein HupE